MPRSSGGGSHRSSSSYSSSSGGGSHRSSYSSGSSSRSYSSSSSYSSSGSYSSSSYSSRSSTRSSYSSRPAAQSSYTPPKPRVSDKYFKGAQTYVYYRDKQPNYIYTNYTGPERDIRIGRLIFYIFFFIISVAALIDLATPPKKLTDDYDACSIIYDEFDCIGDTDELEAKMDAFLDKTGISPAFVTAHNEEWMPYYDYLDDYAYDLYLNAFDDEKHWLIVYSFPESEEAEFDDWYWTGMMGDDTATILTDEVLDSFNEKMQRGLLARNRMTIAEAVAAAFGGITKEVLDYTPLGPIEYITDLTVLAGIAYLGLRRSGIIISKKKRALPYGIPQDAKKCARPETASKQTHSNDGLTVKPVQPMLKCEYCGSLYEADRSSCPQCGAPRSEKTKLITQ